MTKPTGRPIGGPKNTPGPMTAVDLKTWREAQGLSGRAAAARIGIGTSIWNRFENGQRDIPVEIIDKINAFNARPKSKLSCPHKTWSIATPTPVKTNHDDAFSVIWVQRYCVTCKKYLGWHPRESPPKTSKPTPVPKNSASVHMQFHVPTSRNGSMYCASCGQYISLDPFGRWTAQGSGLHTCFGPGSFHGPFPGSQPAPAPLPSQPIPKPPVMLFFGRSCRFTDDNSGVGKIGTIVAVAAFEYVWHLLCLMPDGRLVDVNVSADNAMIL